MQILVTGATGRIGANLVMRLLEQGHTIRSFVYPADAIRRGEATDVIPNGIAFGAV